MVFALAVALAQASSPVTFQSTATTLKALMPELSKATGMNLQAARDVEWEIIYVRVKDVKPEDLLAKIATAVSGRWQKTADGAQILTKDTSGAAALAEEERKEFVKSLNEAFKFAASDTKTPAQEKVLHAIAQRVGVPTLVGIGQDRRLVFSTAPTQMQRAINLDNGQIQSLILEHNKQVDKDAISENSQTDEEMKQMEALLPPELVKMGKDMEAAMRPKRINDNPAKINVAFTNQYNTISVEVTMYSRQGEKLGDFSTSIGSRHRRSMRDAEMGEEDEEAETKGGQGETEKPTPDKTPVIKFSEDAAQIIALGTFESEGTSPAVTAKLKPRVLNFAKADPILTTFTEILDGYAKNSPHNIVAGVDESFYMFENPKQATVREIEEDIFGFEIKDGWSVSESYSEARVNRDLLIEGIEMLKASDRVGIEERAWFAAREDALGGDYNPVVDLVLSVFGGETFSWQRKPLLKLYGSLNKAQRQSARSQNGLAVSSLSADQRRMIESVCFGADLLVRPYGAADDMFEDEGLFSFDFQSMITKQMAIMKAQRGYLMEPTESMPTGIPNNAIIRLENEDSKVFLPVSTGGDSSFSFFGEMGGMTSDMLASMLAMGEMMGQAEFMGEMPKEVKRANRNTLKITLACTPEVGYVEQHREAIPSGDGKPVKLSDLGDDFNKLLAKKKEDMKRWKPMFDMGMGMGRRGSGPPPAQ